MRFFHLTDPLAYESIMKSGKISAGQSLDDSKFRGVFLTADRQLSVDNWSRWVTRDFPYGEVVCLEIEVPDKMAMGTVPDPMANNYAKKFDWLVKNMGSLKDWCFRNDRKLDDMIGDDYTCDWVLKDQDIPATWIKAIHKFEIYWVHKKTRQRLTNFEYNRVLNTMDRYPSGCTEIPHEKRVVLVDTQKTCWEEPAEKVLQHNGHRMTDDGVSE
jgi:hypothetical protein